MNNGAIEKIKRQKEAIARIKCETGMDLDLTNLEEEQYSNLRLFTGIPEVDSITNGLRPGLTVIAGFTKCCKTTFTLNIILKALNEGKNVCLLSLEMTKRSVLNALVSLLTYEIDPEASLTRDELDELYHLDRNGYNKKLNLLKSLPGTLIVLSEKELEESVTGTFRYSEENLNRVFENANKYFVDTTGKEAEVVAVDNINCIKKWENTTSESGYTQASNYFRKISLNFAPYVDYDTNGSKKQYGGKPVIMLLVSQVNRTGGQQALEWGYYPPSCIAETVSMERDCTALISILVQPFVNDVARIKLELSRFSAVMDMSVDCPLNLPYAKVGLPLGEINIDKELYESLKEGCVEITPGESFEVEAEDESFWDN